MVPLVVGTLRCESMVMLGAERDPVKPSASSPWLVCSHTLIPPRWMAYITHKSSVLQAQFHTHSQTQNEEMWRRNNLCPKPPKDESA